MHPNPILPTPLLEVLEREGVVVPRFAIHALSSIDWGPAASARGSSRSDLFEADKSAGARCVRWELFGLPGLGKSSIARTVAASSGRAAPAVLVLPEAVPYAVHVHHIALADLEPFLDLVNSQAEVLARTTAGAVQSSTVPAGHSTREERENAQLDQARSLIIVRDPAHQQNECYRYVLHALRVPSDPVAQAIMALGTAVAGGRWPDGLADEIGALLSDRHAALRGAPVGTWQLGHVVLTTNDPLGDLRLSLERQHDGRDARLVTGDPTVLAGYFAAIRYVESTTSTSLRLVIDPRDSADTLARAVLEASATALAASQ